MLLFFLQLTLVEWPMSVRMCLDEFEGFEGLDEAVLSAQNVFHLQVRRRFGNVEELGRMSIIAVIYGL